MYRKVTENCHDCVLWGDPGRLSSSVALVLLPRAIRQRDEDVTVAMIEANRDFCGRDVKHSADQIAVLLLGEIDGEALTRRGEIPARGVLYDGE